MPPFNFNTVPHIQFETGASARLGALIKGRMRRPFIVTDKGVLAAGLVNDALKSCREEGLDVYIDDEVVADPPVAMVKAAVENARAHKADGVIGFGGGSSMDTAKLIAALISTEQSLEDMLGVEAITGERTPLVLVPTTAGTGSEVTAIAIVTTQDDQKVGVVSNKLYADMAILDARLTLTAPRHVTAATGIDAMVHAIEAYTSKLKKNPVSDALAKEALRLLSNNLLDACEGGTDNLKARENMLLGAMLAGQAFANAPVAAVHAMAYPLGALFHVPHGVSNALMLAPVLRFNAPAAQALYAELGTVIGANEDGDIPARADAFVNKLTALCEQAGGPQRLNEVGVSHNDLPRMAEDVMKIDRLLQNNPRPMTYDDALRLYQEVL